ncbi:GNAT family N-acetyltransferase [Aeromicrobium sp.]|uniref:GNAT family N-acetyltransferase n=1 Tax=Aeromicrobium sp. TaxID=1871063 RepID=UPI003C313C7E
MASENLVGRWIEAWAHARVLEIANVDGWPLVRVGSPSRESEIVCADPGRSTFAAMLQYIAGDPRAMLTVIAPDTDTYRSLPLPPGVRVDRDDEVLMATRLATRPLQATDPGFTTRWDLEDRRRTYSVEHDGRVVASGVLGVLGTDAVYDAVETIPRYRRRGLARHVMVALSNRAIDEGATAGILAASADGRHLYEALGWQSRLDMWSLMGAV